MSSLSPRRSPALARAVAWNRLHGPDTRMSGGSKNLVSPGGSAGPRSANDVDDDGRSCTRIAKHVS